MYVRYKRREIKTMKQIAITEKNTDKITAAIEAVQGRCKQRTITAADVLKLPAKLKDRYGIPYKAMEGCRFDYDANAQDFPKAYKYTPESTVVTVTVKGGKFYLAYIDREKTFPASHNVEARFTDEAKKAILESICKVRV